MLLCFSLDEGLVLSYVVLVGELCMMVLEVYVVIDCVI